MEINYEKNQIIIYGRPIKYDSFIKKLAELSGEQIYGFFSSRGTLIPRKMNCMALISVLNQKIKFLHSNSLTKDYFQRLQYYKDFTETQLENLFLAVNSESKDFYQYKYNLMKLIVDNHEALKLNDGEVKYLRDLPKQKEIGFENYVGYISAACIEQSNTFDGVEIENLKKDLMLTATNQEIILIGEKYGITIPERLSKEEYVEFIKDYLKKNDKYTDEAAEILDDMNITQLSSYAKREGIPMQPQMSKDDLVTYLFYYLENCEIPASDINEIKCDEALYKPLEFTVDLSSISPFGLVEAKKIIHYEGEEADNEAFEAMLNPTVEVLEEASEPEEIEEEVVEELPPVEIERPLRPGEFTRSDNENNDNEIPEEVLESVGITNDVVEEEPIEIVETKPEEIKIPLKDQLGIDISSKEKNDLYGSKKYDKSQTSFKAYFIFTIVMIALFVGVVLTAVILLR